MRTQLYIQKKARSKSASVPVSNPFQSRPFASLVQPEGASLQQQERPGVQAQPEQAKGFGYNFANVSVTPRDPSPPPFLQRKLTIGQPGDKYEQEADQVATQVVSQINAPATQPSNSVKSIQREDMPERDEEPRMNLEEDTLQRREISEEEKADLTLKPITQHQQVAAGGTATSSVEASIQQAKGRGQSLPNPLRRKLEGAMGSNFSNFKVHTDAQSDQLNRSLQSRAFTTGNDVFFRQGAYEPGSQQGQELLAHELTHVVQQAGSSQLQRKEAKGHSTGCGCPVCTSRIQRKVQNSQGVIQRWDDGSPSNKTTTSNAMLADHREKQQFIQKLMSDQNARTRLHNIPSTGMGRFDAEYLPATGQLLITVRPYFDYQGVWSAKEKVDIEQEFIQQTKDAWSDKFTIQCIKPGWEDLVVHPVVNVVLASDLSNAHFDMTIAKDGDRGGASGANIKREQTTALGNTDPATINKSNAPTVNTGIFHQGNAPIRPHDDTRTTHSIAVHDVERINTFIKGRDINPISFDEKTGAVASDAVEKLRSLKAAINKTDLPGSAPVPLLVYGFGNKRKHLLSIGNPAKARAAKVAKELKGMPNHPIVEKQIEDKIAEQTKKRDEEGGRKGSYLYNQLDAPLQETLATRHHKQATVEADEKFAESWTGNLYSILAHEFGHMLGNPDEYFLYGTATLDQRIAQLLKSGDPDKVREAQNLQAKKNAGQGFDDQDAQRSEIQSKYAQLVDSANLEIPEFGPKTSSIMSAGADLLPRHYTPLWEALGRITSPDIKQNEWKLG